MFEMSEVLNIDLNQTSSETTLDDIDDNVNDISFDIHNATTPELPHRDFNIATLTQEKLNELRKSSN